MSESKLVPTVTGRPYDAATKRPVPGLFNVYFEPMKQLSIESLTVEMDAALDTGPGQMVTLRIALEPWVPMTEDAPTYGKGKAAPEAP